MPRIAMVVLLLSLSGLTLAAGSSDKKPGRYEALYEQLMNLEADPARIAHVERLQIVKQGGTITLEKGTLAFCKPVDGRDFAVVFNGNGIFVFNPPNAMERGQIQRTFETDTLVRKFESMVLFAADSTFENLTANLAFASGETNRAQRKALREALEYQGDKDGKNADFAVMKTLLEGFPTGLFYAFIAGGDGDPIMFSINPLNEEEISLMRRADASHFVNYGEAISSFPYKHPSSDMQRAKNWFSVERCILSCSFDNSIELQARAGIVIRSQQTGHRWLSFGLHSDLLVDSVTLSNGTRLRYFKEKENYMLWIETAQPLQAGKKDTIWIAYHGDVVTKENGVVYIRSSFHWLPRPFSNEDGKLPKCLYDITYKYPEDFTLVSVGKLVSEERTEDWTTTRWVTEKSVRNVCFNIGRFRTYRSAEGGSLPVNVYTTDYADRGMDKDVAWDVSNAVRFFQQVYGPCLFDSLAVTETPFRGGEAFPGLIHYTLKTFERSGYAEEHASFRAHEVAHQWWAIGVDFESYHDQWLSEGFAEFSGLWYMQLALKNTRQYFEYLQNYRESIMQARHYVFSSGQPAGPIYLGVRNETSTTEGDYSRVVYEKGAWILHMLRGMMLDVNTLSEDRFCAMLKEFYLTYRGTRATTEDFKRLVDKHFGEDMSWFFNEWVYGTDLPTYTFSSTVRPVEGGKFKMHCSVQTKGVSPDFKMPVTMRIEFGDNRYARVRPIVRGTSCEFDLPLFPLEPKKVIFNDLESVLAEVE